MSRREWRVQATITTSVARIALSSGLEVSSVGEKIGLTGFLRVQVAVEA
jgi:hypothetical protein